MTREYGVLTFHDCARRQRMKRDMPTIDLMFELPLGVLFVQGHLSQ